MSPLRMKVKILEAVAKAGGQNRLARKWGISNAYMSEVIRGTRAPGPAILGPMGLKRIKTVKVAYVAGKQPTSNRWPQRRYLP